VFELQIKKIPYMYHYCGRSYGMGQMCPNGP